MDQYSTVESVLMRAVVLEEEAAAMYTMAAAAMKNAEMRKRLLEMAEQERGHKQKLQDILAGNVRWAIRKSKAEPVQDLHLSDHLEPGELSPDADYQDVLLMAARREKGAYEFYRTMAGLVDEPLVKSVFEMLANEELRHKYEVEKTYEEVVYKAF